MRNKFADAQIAIVARPYVADIYRGQGVCDELIAYDPRGAEKGIAGRERLAARLRADKFDAALLLQNAFDGAWLVWRAGIPERIGYARDGRRILLTKSIAVPKAGEIPEHEQFYYLELVRRAGWVERITGEIEISLAVSRESGELAEGKLAAAGVRSRAGDDRPLRVAIGAGASYGSAKCWLPERFAEVADRLMNESNAEIILFGTAGETAVSDAIIAGMKRKPIDLTGKTAIAELPALLSRCQLFIGNDSGAMHVASAVGLPVVGFALDWAQHPPLSWQVDFAAAATDFGTSGAMAVYNSTSVAISAPYDPSKAAEIALYASNTTQVTLSSAVPATRFVRLSIVGNQGDEPEQGATVAEFAVLRQGGGTLVPNDVVTSL